jgi:hypothetical protein
MTADNTIHALLAGLEATDPGDWRRRAARIAWIKETIAAFRQAQEEMDERCSAAVGTVSEEEFERPCEEEEAKVELFRGPLFALRDHGLWPRHLYWSL